MGADATRERQYYHRHEDTLISRGGIPRPRGKTYLRRAFLAPAAR